MSVFLELAVFGCTTTFSPGPNNILLLSCTSKYGLRRCLPLLFGIWSGLLAILLLCGFGCAWLGEVVPQIVPLAKYVGAAYILYLAYKMLFKTIGSAQAKDQPLTYANGFLLQFLNVKIMMLGITSYSSFLLPLGFHVGRILLYALVMTLCAGTGNLIWATAGSLLFPFYKRYNKLINTVMTVLLVWCAWKILSL